MVQQLDWIRLIKPEKIKKGSVYQAKILLNKPGSEISSVNFYYTTNFATLRQNLAVAYNPGSVSVHPHFQQSFYLSRLNFTMIHLLVA
jgi:hypothetical protein